MSEESEVLINFGRRMREIRESKEVSQESLTHIAELDRTYVSGVERGVRNISLKNIHRIAAALDVSPAMFFQNDRGDL